MKHPALAQELYDPHGKEPQTLMAEPMTFDKLEVDTECKCLEDASIDENTNDQFLRLVKGRKTKLNQFRSLWEVAKRPKDLKDCKAVCMYKGLSLTKIVNGNEQVLLDYYKSLTAVKPSLGDHMLQFKCRPNAGRVWPTPTRKSLWHHTFFKCDAFRLSLIEVIDVVSLR